MLLIFSFAALNVLYLPCVFNDFSALVLFLEIDCLDAILAMSYMERTFFDGFFN